MKRDEAMLLRLALEGLPDGVIVADAYDRVVALNARARVTRGGEKNMHTALPFLFADAISEEVERGVEALKAGTSAEFSVIEREPSSEHLYEHHGIPMRAPDGSFAGTVVVSRDMTGPRSPQLLQEQGLHGQGAFQEKFVDGMITLVDALEARDRYTCGHSTRVALIAGRLAGKVLTDATGIAETELAARLHDIGKVAVPDRLLDKPSGLTPDEMALMDTHPLVGENILRPIAELCTVASIIRSHHERWDGEGYPDGLAGDHIPVGSRILALADTFDAMTSQRPYRASLPASRAQHEIEAHLGSQFDPVIGRVFVDMIGSGGVTAGGPPRSGV